MSAESATAVATAPAETPKAPAPKKAPAARKPGANGKPKARKPAPAKAAKPDRHMGASPAGDRRVALVKRLRQVGATGPGSSRPLGDLAEKLGLTRFDVYGLVNGTSGEAGSNPRCLVATGHVKTCVQEGVRGACVYLTAKGQKGDLDELM